MWNHSQVSCLRCQFSVWQHPCCCALLCNRPVWIWCNFWSIMVTIDYHHTVSAISHIPTLSPFQMSLKNLGLEWLPHKTWIEKVLPAKCSAPWESALQGWAKAWQGAKYLHFKNSFILVNSSGMGEEEATHNVEPINLETGAHLLSHFQVCLGISGS